MRYWLMKSEPDQFGIADLARVKIEPWSGVRSYFARAHMRAMSVGDPVLFHHSNAKPPGVAGTARVVTTGVIDQTQFDPASKYYDPKATREQPIWDCVDVEYVSTLPHFVTMDRIRAEPELADMLLLRRGMRLSVQPITAAEYEAIVALGQIEPPAPAQVDTAPKKPRSAGKRSPAAKHAEPARPARRTASAKRDKGAKRPPPKPKAPARAKRR